MSVEFCFHELVVVVVALSEAFIYSARSGYALALGSTEHLFHRNETKRLLLIMLKADCNGSEP